MYLSILQLVDLRTMINFPVLGIVSCPASFLYFLFLFLGSSTTKSALGSSNMHLCTVLGGSSCPYPQDAVLYCID